MKKIVTAFALAIAFNSVMAAELTVDIYRTAKEAHGASLGTVTFKDTHYGLLITPRLHGLTEGLHGFHVHVNPDCSDMGMKAGGHFDPDHTDKHLGPYDKAGHLGDLPALYVNKKGQANELVLAPRLHVRDLYGHSIMIHQGGDNYLDIPKKLGGGGARIACGVVPLFNGKNKK